MPVLQFLLDQAIESGFKKTRKILMVDCTHLDIYRLLD